MAIATKSKSDRDWSNKLDITLRRKYQRARRKLTANEAGGSENENFNHFGKFVGFIGVV